MDKIGDDVREAFLSGLRGESVEDLEKRRIERRIRTLKKLSAEADERYQRALLKLPVHENPYNDDERYEEVLVEEELFKNGSSLSLLRCFTMAIAIRVYPPESVLNALNDAFLKVLAGGGTVKLDDLLGITGKAQGKRNAFGLEDNLESQTWMTWVLFGLSEGCGLSVMDAADRLSWFLENRPSKVGFYEVESLIQLYSKKWKKRYLVKYTVSHPDHPKHWSSNLKSRLLKRFPSRVKASHLP